MKPVATVRTTCRLCHGTPLELALSMRPTPIADAYVSAEQAGQSQESYPLDLFLCRSCGHVQLVTVIDPKILFCNYRYTTSTSAGLADHFRQSCDDILKRFPQATGGLIVDIGSNDGTYLRFFQQRGFQVLGVDPALEISNKATTEGIETISQFFTRNLSGQIKCGRQTASIITANNVFAHADDLEDIVAGIRELLSPSGIFVFEVAYLPDLIQKNLFDTIYHEHLSYHSVKPLKRFFHRLGLQLIAAQRIPSKSGSLRAFVQRSDGQYTEEASVEQLIAYEDNLGLERLETYQTIHHAIQRLRIKIHDIMRSMTAQGSKIAGYGASATVTTLLYQMELEGTISFLVDDNSARHGLFSPGCHLPILAPSALYEQKPSLVIVLAWPYSKQIVSKHHQFLSQGGHIVLPLPDLEVL